MLSSQVVVDICSSAMIKLGAEPINDLQDNNKEAKLCRIQFGRIRDTVLRSAPWSFARKRIRLTPTTEEPLFGDSFVFQLPADCVKFVRMYDHECKWTIEEDKLLTAAEVVEGWYISNDVAPEKYDANFSEALAYALAADLCYAITQSNSLRGELLNGSKMFMDEARSYNSQEVSPEDFRFDEFINSRRGSYAVYDEPDFI